MKKTILLALLLVSVSAAAQTQPPIPKVMAPRTAQEVPPGTKKYALGPDSMRQPGVPAGTLSEKLSIVSRIYDGMQSSYWIYAPAQYDPKTPAALMVIQDGGNYIDRNGAKPALNVIDNLIAQHKIPVMICVFTDPGDISASPQTPTYRAAQAYADKYTRMLKDSMRSIEYDTVSDRYARFLRDELIPQVAARYNLRKDAYSHAIAGESSGGIAAFNAAWHMPGYFSRVISWIGTFTSLQWHDDPAVPDGGQDYPAKVLHEAHRNIRVWLQDGAYDQENPVYGSWPLANIAMANALKERGYDFGFTFGEGNHSGSQSASEFPGEMTWLWRGYDPALTAQTYTQDPDETARPPFRVSITNREQSPLNRPDPQGTPVPPRPTPPGPRQ